MNNNHFMFFIFVFVGGAILSGVMAGVTGLATTELTVRLTKDATTMTVNSSQGFNDQTDVLLIDKEKICYTGLTTTTFTGLTRGCRGTSATTHEIVVAGQNNRVYSQTPAVIESIIGFDIAESFVGVDSFIGFGIGAFKTVSHLPEFISAVARMIMFDHEFLEGPYVYVRYVVLAAFSGGMVLMFVRFALNR